MKDLGTFFIVGSGGFLGANVRHWLGSWIHTRFGQPFPWHTLIVNVTGSLIMGVFMGLMLGQNWNNGWRLFFAVGVLGGYTTFSAFSHDSIALLSKGNYSSAFMYIAASVMFSIFATWLGFALVKLLTP
jgi:fluoride exporter